MASGGVLVGALVPSGSRCLRLASGVVLSYMTSAVNWLSQSSLARGEIAIGPAVLVGFYAALLLIVIFLKRQRP